MKKVLKTQKTCCCFFAFYKNNRTQKLHFKPFPKILNRKNRNFMFAINVRTKFLLPSDAIKSFVFLNFM